MVNKVPLAPVLVQRKYQQHIKCQAGFCRADQEKLSSPHLSEDTGCFFLPVAIHPSPDNKSWTTGPRTCWCQNRQENGSWCQEETFTNPKSGIGVILTPNISKLYFVASICGKLTFGEDSGVRLPSKLPIMDWMFVHPKMCMLKSGPKMWWYSGKWGLGEVGP